MPPRQGTGAQEAAHVVASPSEGMRVCSSCHEETSSRSFKCGNSQCRKWCSIGEVPSVIDSVYKNLNVVQRWLLGLIPAAFLAIGLDDDIKNIASRPLNHAWFRKVDLESQNVLCNRDEFSFNIQNTSGNKGKITDIVIYVGSPGENLTRKDQTRFIIIDLAGGGPPNRVSEFLSDAKLNSIDPEGEPRSTVGLRLRPLGRGWTDSFEEMVGKRQNCQLRAEIFVDSDADPALKVPCSCRP